MKYSPSKKRKKAKPPLLQASRSRALVLSDGSALRERTLLEISEIREKIAKSDLEIETHVSKSEPEFRAWMHEEFKELIEKSRELLGKISEKQSIFAQVDDLIYDEDLDPGEAYELVTNPEAMAAFQQKREKRAEKEAKFDGFSDFNPFGDPAGENYHDFMKGMAEEFEKMFGFKPPFEEKGEQASATQTRSDRSEDLEVKRAYREIVKRLHPDRATLWSANEKALWNQAQQAYHHGDLDGLREVLQALGSGSTGSAESDRVGDLIARLQRLKREFWERQKTLAQHQRTPAWRFSFKNLKGLLKIRKKTELEIRSEYRELQYKMEDIQEEWQNLLDDHRRWKMRQGIKSQRQIGSKKRK